MGHFETQLFFGIFNHGLIASFEVLPPAWSTSGQPDDQQLPPRNHPSRITCTQRSSLNSRMFNRIDDLQNGLDCIPRMVNKIKTLPRAHLACHDAKAIAHYNNIMGILYTKFNRTCFRLG